jgi:RNA-directed DNA polymerase
MIQQEELRTWSKENKAMLQNFFSNPKQPLTKKLKTFKKHEISALRLLSLETPLQLCHLLETPFFELEEWMSNPLYESFEIKKKRSGSRTISAPHNKLKCIQKRLNYLLQAYYLCIKPDEVYGFVIRPHYLGKHCPIAQNASVHVKKKYVLNIDLKDFFQNISAYRVKKLFSSDVFQFSDQMATALTMLITYKGHLPTGAPTSPVISNFSCLQMDAQLKQFCQQHEISYSRYADDLSFSSDNAFSEELKEKIRNVIHENHFQLNEKKFRLKSSNRKQTVTGLTVNQKVNVNRTLLKKIRAMVHDLTANGLEHATHRHFKTANVTQIQKVRFINRLLGYIQFIGQVRGKNDPLYIKYKTIMKQR